MWLGDGINGQLKEDELIWVKVLSIKPVLV